MSRLLRAAPLALGVALIAILLWRFGLGDLARALGRVSPRGLLLYFAFAGPIVAAYALRLHLILRSLGCEVPLSHLASAWLAGDAVANLIPSARLAGDPVRVAIVHAGGVEGTRATAGVTLDRMLEMIGNTVCALVYLTVFSLTHALGTGERPMQIFAAVMIVAAAALAAPIAMLRLGKRPLLPFHALLAGRPRAAPWRAAVRRTEDHLMRFFQERPAAFFWGFVLTMAIEALVVAEYHFLLGAFGVDIDLPTLLLALVGTGVAHAIPAPAALGTLEGTQVAVLTIAVGDPALGFLVGLIVRLHETLFAVLGMAALSFHGLSLARLPGLRPSPEAVG